MPAIRQSHNLTLVFYAESKRPDMRVTVPAGRDYISRALAMAPDPNQVLGIKNTSGQWVD